MIRVGLFVIASMLLAHVSKASLRRWRAHGFYRFLAWEFILLLSLLNFRGVEQWFGDPASWRQLASWILLFGSIVPAVWGAHLLRSRGGALAARDDRELLAFERTTRLVTAGIYKYIRHPMYASQWLWVIAQVLLLPNWLAGVGGLLLFLPLYFVRVPLEEQMMLAQFGEQYRAYMQRTGRVLPRLGGRP